jgi:hypothetical protein
MGNGVTLAVSSSQTSPGQVRWNNFDTSEGYRPRHPWRPWGDPASSSFAFRRMSSAFTTDSHAWIFSVLADGSIANRWETTAGAWSNWGRWFEGSSMSTGALDVDATSAGSVAIQVYSVSSTGAVRTRRKVGNWNSAWGNESDLGTVAGARAIAVGVVQGFQQIFVVSSSAVSTRWETSAGSNAWSSWVDFTSGLPNGAELIDIAAGEDSAGRMDVYLLLRQGTQLLVFRRTKGSVQAFSAWGSWQSFLAAPKGASQVEIGPVVNGMPRLGLVRAGEILMRRPEVDIESPAPDYWVPAYSPEPTPTAACPAPVSQAICSGSGLVCLPGYCP